MVSLPTNEEGKPNWLLIAVLGGVGLAFLTVVMGKKSGTATVAGSLTPDEMVALGSIQQQILELKGITGLGMQDIMGEFGGISSQFEQLGGNITLMFGKIGDIMTQLTNIGMSFEEQKQLLTDIGAKIDPITGALEGFGTQFADITDLLEGLKTTNPSQYNYIVGKYPKLKYTAKVDGNKYKFSWQGWPNWWQTPPEDWKDFFPPWFTLPAPGSGDMVMHDDPGEWVIRNNQNNSLDAGPGNGQLMTDDQLQTATQSGTSQVS